MFNTTTVKKLLTNLAVIDFDVDTFTIMRQSDEYTLARLIIARNRQYDLLVDILKIADR